MAKYYLNPATLQFEKVVNTRKEQFLGFLRFTALVVILLVTISMISEDVVQSPKYKKLLAEREQISYELKLLNWSMINYEDLLERIAHNDDHLYRVFFEVDPVPSTKREAGTGGSMLYRDLLNKPESELLIAAYTKFDRISRQLVIQSRSFDEVIEFARTKEQRMAAKPSIQPVSIADLKRFGSAFGMRMHPILNEYRHHDGIDLTAPAGTKIYATADGVVEQAQYTTGGYGRKILVNHGFGYKTLYGHCQKVLVSAGQQVKRGEVIGLVGNTGLSVRPHLHYEVWVNDRPVDPFNYYANDLSPGEYDKMISLLSTVDPSFDIN